MNLEISPATAEAARDAFRLIIPEIALAAGACLLFLGSTFRPGRNLWGGAALATLAVAAFALFAGPAPSQPVEGLTVSPLIHDHLAILVKAIVFAGVALLVLCGWNDMPASLSGEYHACLLLVAAGGGLTAAANDLVGLFLALELVSIPTYLFLYLPRSDRQSQEAATKYFLLSVFSSALLLFGFSYLYGLGGSTNLAAIRLVFQLAGNDQPPALTYVALVMIVAGLGFRITAVPFHFYAPDVYQGTSPTAAALLAFLPKVVGFAALFRLLGLAWSAEAVAWLEHLADTAMRGRLLSGYAGSILLWILAAATMTVGNWLGLLQDNLRRLLAYSSVAHAGYMLIGLSVASLAPAGAGGAPAVLFYLIAYGAMTIGAFTVLANLHTDERPVEEVDDLAGLSRSHPVMAMLMALFLLSLIGLPLTAGFAGKFLLFLEAIGVQDANVVSLYRLLALIGVLNAAVGAWFYLRVLSVMYLRNSLRPPEATCSWPARAALWICAGVTLLGGVYPDVLFRLARGIP